MYPRAVVYSFIRLFPRDELVVSLPYAFTSVVAESTIPEFQSTVGK